MNYVLKYTLLLSVDEEGSLGGLVHAQMLTLQRWREVNKSSVTLKGFLWSPSPLRMAANRQNSGYGQISCKTYSQGVPAKRQRSGWDTYETCLKLSNKQNIFMSISGLWNKAAEREIWECVDKCTSEEVRIHTEESAMKCLRRRAALLLYSLLILTLGWQQLIIFSRASIKIQN